MPPGKITFRLVSGVRKGTRREVGFLDGNPELNAKYMFGQLEQGARQRLLASIQAWNDGLPDITHRFHGFTNDTEYPALFVFKVKEASSDHRLYGFLFHPQPVTNSRLTVCVLCIHGYKTTHDTDRTVMKQVDLWSRNNAALAVIREKYPDDPPADQKKGQVLRWRTK